MDILTETIKGFNGLTIQSTINDCAYYDPEEYNVESDPNRDPKVATHTNNQNSQLKLLINRLIPEIIPAAITPIDQKIAEDAAGIGEILQARHSIISKEIVMDAAPSTVRIFRTPVDVSSHGMDGTTPQDGNTAVGSSRLTSPVRFLWQYHQLPKTDWEPRYYQFKGAIRSSMDHGRRAT